MATLVKSAAAACRSLSLAQIVVPRHQPLIQIHRRYTARLDGLAFTVDSETDQWTASVVDLGTNRILHTVHRLSARAAKSAVVEFAMFERETPEEAATNLKWIECW